MLNPTLIQQFHSEPHAIHNDGSLEQLREVMKEFYPNGYLPAKGVFMFYVPFRDGDWTGTDKTTLPIIPVTSFFT